MISTVIMGSPVRRLLNPITRCRDQPRNRYAGPDDGPGTGQRLDANQLTLMTAHTGSCSGKVSPPPKATCHTLKVSSNPFVPLAAPCPGGHIFCMNQEPREHQRLVNPTGGPRG